MLIVDEIQTGFGRTGKWFAIEHAGIEPDIMCLAKGLGGGFPMGAFAYTKAIRDVLTPGAHGSTFGGSPLACAAGLAAIEAYRDEGLIKRSATLGADMRNQLRGALEGVADGPRHPRPRPDDRGRAAHEGRAGAEEPDAQSRRDRACRPGRPCSACCRLS